MLAIEYNQSQGDQSLFIKHRNSKRIITLLVYVDDIIMTRNDEEERVTLKQCLVNEFEIKELEKLKYPRYQGGRPLKTKNLHFSTKIY